MFQQNTSELNFKECFLFPFSSRQARRDTFEGAIWLVILPVGWVMNLGHRLDVVKRLFHDESPFFQGFRPFSHTFLRGLRATMAIAVYLTPSLFLAGLVHSFQTPRYCCLILTAFSVIAFLLGIFSLPGGMTYNAAFDDISYLYRPDKAFRRAVRGGQLYLKAWCIGLTAIILSLLGLLVFGVGFLYSSVWAWQVVGFAFSKALVIRHHADVKEREPS